MPRRPPLREQPAIKMATMATARWMKDKSHLPSAICCLQQRQEVCGFFA